MEPAPWLPVPFSDTRQTVSIINLISIAAGFFQGLRLKRSACSSRSRYWKSQIRKQGTSVCKFLYVHLCAPYERGCMWKMASVLSVRYSYHCLIMEERLGSFITEPGWSGDLGAGVPCSKGLQDAEKVTELKSGKGKFHSCVSKSQGGQDKREHQKGIVLPACHGVPFLPSPSIGE